jgi:hypothetical protein
MGWATVWAIISQTHLVTLVIRRAVEIIEFRFRFGRNQGCQIFLGPNMPNWEKYTK